MSLSGRLSGQSNVVFSHPVESEEALSLAFYCGHIGEIGVFPDVPLILLMEALHSTVALRVVYRREEQLRSYQ